jgi:Zn-finger nucleic acid-binding protein
MSLQRRHGVEIDICPACRGVWLDRGELDRIVERSSRYYEVPPDYPGARDVERVRRDSFEWF